MTNRSCLGAEGALIASELLLVIAKGDAPGQKPADFHLPRGSRLPDEISSAWADAQSYWSIFQRRRSGPSERDPNGNSASRTWVASLLALLSFQLEPQAQHVVAGSATFPVSHLNRTGEVAVPVHFEGFRTSLDARPSQRAQSARALLQELLNRAEEAGVAYWGLASNGLRLRLMRQSSRTVRPAYLEFDLEAIFEGARFSDFSLFYRLCHSSRFSAWLERYYQQSLEQGQRVRGALRVGVEEALQRLGSGFLQHPANLDLRQRVESGALSAEGLHRQLLMLVYRLLFLMVAEERRLICSQGPGRESRQRLYDDWYSVSKLRERAAQPIADEEFSDLWQGLLRTFALFEYGAEGNPFSIPPLNGRLFDRVQSIPDLAAAQLSNQYLLIALRKISLFAQDGVLQRINYSALDVEELGSVYEGLLDYRPVVNAENEALSFRLVAGSERKRTGSYYTRPELVHELVESALVPVVRDRMRGTTGRAEREASLLGISVCDPACGSGHFLLAAARRLAAELAQVRSDGGEPGAEEYRLAVRDVIAHCLYGVDLNPLAVDLCQLALWLESHSAGMPLTFLDHRIRCGNSLVGVLDPASMDDGLPDDAFAPVAGDDKAVAKALRRQNKNERETHVRPLPFGGAAPAPTLARDWTALDALSDHSAAEVKEKAALYTTLRAGPEMQRRETVAHLWTAQFFQTFTPKNQGNVCTTGHFLDFARGHIHNDVSIGPAVGLAAELRFFHWRLEFPNVFAKGGFDAVLGNPPWERIKLQEQEFWAGDSFICGAANAAERTRRIATYRDSSDPRQQRRWRQFEAARHAAAAGGKFARASGRFPLSSAGDINTYALFADLARQLLNPRGRAGVIVESGIATDHTNQHFFRHLIESRALASLWDFENRAGLFPKIDSRMKFALLTLAAQPQPQAQFAFFLTAPEQLLEPARRIQLTAADLALFNPNTHTAPVFRTAVDAALTRKIYASVPVLVNEHTGENPWGVQFRAMFHMSNDSDLFLQRKQLEGLGGGLTGNIWLTAGGERFLPLYEGKMFHQFDPRWASWDGEDFRDCTPHQKADPAFVPLPRYWVCEVDVIPRLPLDTPRLLAFRDIARSTDERTCIAALLPRTAVGHTAPLASPSITNLGFFVNFDTLPFDYAARQKISSTHLTYFILKQLPVLPPTMYRTDDLAWIEERALALSEPEGWDEAYRAQLRADLDAFYAHLYGLTRLELRYILDPEDVFGPDFPGETFRVLKKNELRDVGEFRTRRLVLAAFDQLAESPRFQAEMTARVCSIAPLLPGAAAREAAQ